MREIIPTSEQSSGSHEEICYESLRSNTLRGSSAVQKHIGESDQKRPLGYLVKAWPRLSETFILNEIVGIERSGVRLRIFSVKDPNVEPVHARVAQVRAKVTYLSLLRHWKSTLKANLRLLCRQPGRYRRTSFQAIAQAIRHRRFAAVRHFLKAGYVADILFREPVAHLHAHFATAPALIAMFTHQLTEIPYSLTAHAKDIYVTPPDLLRPKVQKAQAVITCTEYNRRYLLSQFGPALDGKLYCIYHGIDLSQFKFRWPPPCDSEAPLILSVGRLVEKKGLGDLILAADILRRQGRCFRIEIIGTGPLRRALETQVMQLGLLDRVRLLGAQPHEIVRLAYQRAAVFALPCRVAANGDRDGIPNVLLEAMASGTPVVSTPVSGIPELIDSEHDGLLVPPSNPMLLANALDRLLTQRELSERLARAARAKIEACFSMDQATARLLAIFHQTAHENSEFSHAAAPVTACCESASGDQ